MLSIKFEKDAAMFFKKLDKSIQERIAKKIEELKINPKIGVPLTANLAGLWKLRSGDYRIIYQIRNQELIVVILKIGHRKNVYE